MAKANMQFVLLTRDLTVHSTTIGPHVPGALAKNIVCIRFTIGKVSRQTYLGTKTCTRVLKRGRIPPTSCSNNVLTKHPKLLLVRGSLLLVTAAVVANDWSRMPRAKQLHVRLTGRNKFGHRSVGFEMPTFVPQTVP